MFDIITKKQFFVFKNRKLSRTSKGVWYYYLRTLFKNKVKKEKKENSENNKMLFSMFSNFFLKDTNFKKHD